jgi:hypothetical protein
MQMEASSPAVAKEVGSAAVKATALKAAVWPCMWVCTTPPAAATLHRAAHTVSYVRAVCSTSTVRGHSRNFFKPPAFHVMCIRGNIRCMLVCNLQTPL